MSAPEPLCWLAYHSDFSGMTVFADEIEALRYAVHHSMQVRPLNSGDEIR